MLTALFLALLVPAHAGEVQIEMSQVFIVLVDGNRANPEQFPLRVVRKNLEEGAHIVEVKNLLGQTVSQGSVEVGADERVMLEYKNRALVEVGRVAMSVQPIPVVPKAEAEIQAIPKAEEIATVGLSTTVDGVSTGLVATATIDSTEMGVTVAMTTEAPQPVTRMENSAPVSSHLPLITESSLRALIQAVEDASFGDDQVGVIQTAAANNHFSCGQLARLLAPINHADDKVAAVQAARNAVADPQNAHELEASFAFSDDKETVRALFR